MGKNLSAARSVFAFAVSLTSLIAASPATADTFHCTDVEVAFARGTDQPPGVGEPGHAFVTELRKRLLDKRVNYYGVDYPAARDIASVRAGAADLSAYVHELASHCPNSRIVIGGFSQGAAVVEAVVSPPAELTVPIRDAHGAYSYRPIPGGDELDIFDTPIGPEDRGRIDAIVLFGNSARRNYNGAAPLLDGFRSGIAIDLCNTDDPACQTMPEADIARTFPNHLNYHHTSLPAQAADFVVKELSRTSTGQRR